MLFMKSLKTPNVEENNYLLSDIRKCYFKIENVAIGL